MVSTSNQIVGRSLRVMQLHDLYNAIDNVISMRPYGQDHLLLLDLRQQVEKELKQQIMELQQVTGISRMSLMELFNGQ